MKRVSRVASVGPSVEGGVILSNYDVDLYNSFCETMKGLGTLENKKHSLPLI